MEDVQLKKIVDMGNVLEMEYANVNLVMFTVKAIDAQQKKTAAMENLTNLETVSVTHVI